MHGMQAPFNQEALPVNRHGLKSLVFTRTNPGLPLTALVKRCAAFVAMRISSSVLEAELAPGVSVAMITRFSRSGQCIGLNACLRPLPPSKGGSQGSAMLLAPAKLVERLVAFGNRGRKVEEIHSAAGENESGITRRSNPTLDQRVVGNGELTN